MSIGQPLIVQHSPGVDGHGGEPVPTYGGEGPILCTLLSGPNCHHLVLLLLARCTGQTEDVAHSYAARAVEVLTSLWHFSLPVLDDATDLWLLLETFGGSHHGLWWTCLCVFVVADIERLYTAFFFVAMMSTILLYYVSCGAVYLAGCMSFLASGAARRDNDDRVSWHCLLDSLLWTLFGSRARSSPFMRVFGLAGDSSGKALKDAGLGLHAIDVIVFYHPFRYFGEWVMSFPRGHRRAEVGVRNQAHRRKISMVRAVGETLWVDPLFLALSVVSGGWDDSFVGLTVFSALFSVLELVTELQYYVAEAEDGKELSYAAVGRDVEVGVGGSENSDPRPIELSLVGSSHG